MLDRRRPTRAFALLTLPLALSLSVIAGCSNNQQPAASPPPSPVSGAQESGAKPAGAAQPRSGESLYATSGCSNCHGEIGGQGGRRAPDLSHEGARHDAAWIAAQIENPRSHNPQSRMPAYGQRFQAVDLKALSDYLAGLK